MLSSDYMPVENTSYHSMEFPPTIKDKELFRLSINSQSSDTTTTTNTSSQRLSVASLEEDTHIVYNASPLYNNNNNNSTSLSPSSRYLLSGFSTSENLRNKVLSRFYPSSSSSHRHQKSLSDPYINTVMPSIDDSVTNCIEPWCMSAKIALGNCILSGWMHKHEPPTFAFSRSWKPRMFVLVDRILFVFKSNKPTNPAREYFVLTDDTFVFVTEEFKKGYVIELRKPLCKWFIRCDSIDQMKQWLEAMKKIVACIKIGYDGLLNATILKSITLTDDYRILIPSHVAAVNTKKSYRQSLPISVTESDTTANTSTTSSSSISSSTLGRKYSLPPKRKSSVKRQSLAEIPDWESTIPSQLPPPTSKPPPVPLAYSTKNNDLPTVSEDF